MKIYVIEAFFLLISLPDCFARWVSKIQSLNLKLHHLRIIYSYSNQFSVVFLEICRLLYRRGRCEFIWVPNKRQFYVQITKFIFSENNAGVHFEYTFENWPIMCVNVINYRKSGILRNVRKCMAGIRTKNIEILYIKLRYSD